MDNAVRYNHAGGRVELRTAVVDGHHGLGLSIVRAIAVAHDASIDAVPQPDGGLAVTVSFAPVSGAAALLQPS